MKCSHHSFIEVLQRFAIFCFTASVKCLSVNSKTWRIIITTLHFQAGRNVRDLFEDLRDGHNLLSLLEMLSGEILVSRDFIFCIINIQLLINCQPISAFLIMQPPGLGHDDYSPDDNKPRPHAYLLTFIAIIKFAGLVMCVGRAQAVPAIYRELSKPLNSKLNSKPRQFMFDLTLLFYSRGSEVGCGSTPFRTWRPRWGSWGTRRSSWSISAARTSSTETPSSPSASSGPSSSTSR